MKRIALWGVLLILLMAPAMAGCSSQPVPVKPTPTAAPNRGTRSGQQIVATGQVTPVKSAGLSFSTGGIVAQLPVALGDRVQAGQVLAQLDTRQLQLQVTQAEATLAGAQAKLNQLVHTPTVEDEAAAQQNVTSAQAALAAAQQNYVQVKAGPSADQLRQLKAQADNARAALDQAQAAFDKIGGASNPNIGQLPQSVQLQQATNNYTAALAAFNEARAHPTAAELSAALSQVQQAQAAVQTAQTQLAKLQPTADDRAALQASVNAAQAARDLAAEQLKEAQLVAPFAGIIETLDINAGEYVMPGTLVLHLADTSTWQVETTDLTELNIANVQLGNPVTLTFDAIPDLQLSGRVTSIQPYGQSKQGDIDYTVVVTPDQQDPRLRWNMTAKVSIEASQ
jgi:HlyD family secretion protein